MLDLLAMAPDTGALHPHRRIPEVRRALLPRTRYHVYYVHDIERDEVVVLALWSALRRRAPPLRQV